mmetsp:Transcript_11159/g.23645  ORF Transcript_11159/g.23645 Transcript_11159/m.23645 type:complete len:119 (-) Transcript_11159:320-676(-)|eukprot:CAMPEP_0201240582 /NCGR_PEP_ID=MMETSP0852-20130820/30282_1 /ASSEMBLY_ACC=CAM_ASM_000632 /TAXON_ID=183588 /ORGANISM="Pseudo-nitzschia fraudulenta, Strain WWA7" /LENGTH=118 /DNA_ID=CAMNT_0047536463 /DNA_START=471 /DNA_END=827 /DNA_ORIENTATION=-
MTPQGRAIKQASVDFGDGKTLPFAPCKRGYVPVVTESRGDHGSDSVESKKHCKRMVACSFHEKSRRKRLAREKDNLRGGEADPNELFWSKWDSTAAEPKKSVKKEKQKTKKDKTPNKK